MTNVKPGTKGFIELDAAARFDAKVDKSGGPDQCWSWLGGADANGYGRFWLGGRTHHAPRIAWSFHHGRPFPQEMFACHTCDKPNCVNPAHIWVGTNSDNMRDAVEKGRHKSNALSGWQKTKTECKRGHPLAAENLYITTDGSRCCRACQRMHNAEYRARKAKAHV